MSNLLLLLLLVGMAIGGYWLMGRLDLFFQHNLGRERFGPRKKRPRFHPPI